MLEPVTSVAGDGGSKCYSGAFSEDSKEWAAGFKSDFLHWKYSWGENVYSKHHDACSTNVCSKQHKRQTFQKLKAAKNMDSWKFWVMGIQDLKRCFPFHSRENYMHLEEGWEIKRFWELWNLKYFKQAKLIGLAVLWTGHAQCRIQLRWFFF